LGTDIPFQAITETIDIDQGDKDFDPIAILNGGRIEKITPEGPTEVTLEAYPLYTGNSDISAATSGTGFFDLLHAEDTSGPFVIPVTRARSRYRLAIMWTSDTTLTNANAAVGSTVRGARWVGADGFIISARASFTDGILKWTVKFKVSPFDNYGSANVAWMDNRGTSTLTAIVSYVATTASTTAKW